MKYTSTIPSRFSSTGFIEEQIKIVVCDISRQRVGDVEQGVVTGLKFCLIKVVKPHISTAGISEYGCLASNLDWFNSLVFLVYTDNVNPHVRYRPRRRTLRQGTLYQG